MSISFTKIPSDVRVPLFYAEVDPRFANSAEFVQRALLIGQKTSTGAATANTPEISQGAADAKSRFGEGSMLARMVATYRANDPFGELWCLPLADDNAAVAAAGAITFTHVATAAGTLAVYVGGRRVTMAVTSSQTLAQLATALAAAINAVHDLPVTATTDDLVATAGDNTKVDITAKNKGAAGNDIDLQVDYLGAAGGEALPTGLTLTVTAMSAGATNPVLTTGLANLLDEPFDFIALPYTDTTSLNALKSFLDDTSGRWSWVNQIYGHSFAVKADTFGNLVTLGTGRNDQHGSILGIYKSPTPPEEIAAAFAAQAGVSDRANHGTPIRDVPLLGVLAPPLANRFALSDRNTLLHDGISTTKVASDGTVFLESSITTYQQNSFGQPDNSYLKVETLLLLQYVLRFLKIRITTRYARMKLADNATRILPGSNVVNPNIVKADQIAAYQELEEGGFVQNSAAFAKALIVERNAQNPNRLDVLWPGILINQLDIFALLAQFRLSASQI